MIVAQQRKFYLFDIKTGSKLAATPKREFDAAALYPVCGQNFILYLGEMDCCAGAIGRYDIKTRACVRIIDVPHGGTGLSFMFPFFVLYARFNTIYRKKIPF